MARLKGRDLRIGDRIWLRGTNWRVLQRDPDGFWIAQATDKSGRITEIARNETVWAREPSKFEKVAPPGTVKKRKHDHRWKEVAGGQGRLCEVCGRGEQKTSRGWKKVTEPTHRLR